MALSSGMAEALHLRHMRKEAQNGIGLTTFNYDHNKTITLLTDRTSAISLASRLGVNRIHISLPFCGYKTYDNKRSRHVKSEYS